jgi:uncharacterized membrane protein YtjA (UPF0391 family)
MSWALPFLFIRLIANTRGSNGVASILPETTWSLLVVSLILLLISVIASRRSMQSLWPRFQRRAVLMNGAQSSQFLPKGALVGGAFSALGGAAVGDQMEDQNQRQGVQDYATDQQRRESEC